MNEKHTVVRFHTLLAELLEIDEKTIKEKLEKLPEKIIETISSNKKVIITGILEIKPDILEPGCYLNTYKNEYVNVPARIAPRVKLQHRFVLAVKDKRLKNLNFY